MRTTLRGRRSGLLWSFIIILIGFTSLGYMIYQVPSLPMAPTPVMPTAALPTATPMPDVTPLIQSYHEAERAVLLTLSPDVLNQLPVFAHGAALDELTKKVEALKAANQYQKLQIDKLAVIQVADDSPYLNVLTSEVHTIDTYPQTPANAPPIKQEKYLLDIVYQLIYDTGRWKVSKIVVTNQSPP